MIQLRGRKVLVTGAGGLVGKHLVARLVNAEATVTAQTYTSFPNSFFRTKYGNRIKLVQADLLEPSAAAEYTRDQEIVFHLAAVPGNRQFVENNPGRLFDNIVIDRNVTVCSVKNHVNTLIFSSSAGVYSRAAQSDGAPLAEESLSSPYDPDGAFGWTKLTTEIMLRAYRTGQKIKTVSCRLFSIYGEHAGSDNSILSWIEKIVAGSPIEIWGDGRQERTWLHADDAADALIAAAVNSHHIREMNVGSDIAEPITDTITRIARMIGKEPKMIYKQSESAGPLRRVPNLGVARGLGWKQQIDFATGIRRVIDTQEKKNMVLA